MPTDAVLSSYMEGAVAEAWLSLREGNHGFGALIVQDDKIIAHAHDSDETDHDPTAHAELKAIRIASSTIGKDLSSCVLVCTHEPCPMCATAMVWAKVPILVFGYSIAESIKQGRARIDLDCYEIFRRSGANVLVRSGVMKEQCSVLYDREVRAEVKKLRGATNERLMIYNEEISQRRIAWYAEARLRPELQGLSPLEKAYRVVLLKLGVDETQAQIVRRSDKAIVFHSMNPCPTLEACMILGLDPARVCKFYNEGATDVLVKQVDPRLTFTRNYLKMRPNATYCEELISY